VRRLLPHLLVSTSRGVAARSGFRSPRGSRVTALTRIIAVTNQKGGVGKTTTAVNLAACLAEADLPTLLLDSDPQANASAGLGVRVDDPALSMYGVLQGLVSVAEASVSTCVPGLSLVPSCQDLAGAVVELATANGHERVLAGALRGRLDPYRFVFIDCPPSLDLLTVNALTAAGEVLVPVQSEYYALEGLAHLLETIALVRERLNPGLEILGVLVTMLDSRTRLGREVAAEVREHLGTHVFEAVVPRNVRLSEAPSHGLPISRYDATCAGCDAYFDLAKEVVSRGQEAGAR
jgi:chromosome partitioning protein